MRLLNLDVNNFRGLQSVQLRTRAAPQAVVITGPNAVGKTTLLESVRLLKSLLSPSYQNEPVHALNDMGAMLPGNSAVDLSSLSRSADKPVEIEAELKLTPEELSHLHNAVPEWARHRLANRLGLTGDSGLKLVQVLSTPQGQEQLEEAGKQIEGDLQRLSDSDPVLRPALEIHPQRGARGREAFDQEALAILSRRSPGYYGLINYFPADRAMATGDVNIQLGSNDYNQQLHSHIGQPAGKYQRMKQYLVSRLLLGDSEKKALEEDFSLIFSELLLNKRLKEIRLMQTGKLSVTIEDESSGATYDIDRMSSGEKGLILTVLLMKRTTARGGIVLLDEPELHLNTSVCQSLLPFLCKHVLEPMEIQAVVCTHSEEILASAYHGDNCELHYLRTPDDLSRIDPQDREEVSEALRALGSSSMDVLFSEGTLYVEGDDDAQLLSTALPDILGQWKVVPLRGRGEVESWIKQLARLDREGRLDTRHAFIFDRDRSAVETQNTKHVRILQWPRYCLENYLLQEDAIYDAILALPHENGDLSRGKMGPMLKQLAMDQITSLAAREAYRSMEPPNPGLRSSEVDNLSNYGDIAEVLSRRLEEIRSSLDSFERSRWTELFVREASSIGDTLRHSWNHDWLSECNGKKVIDALHRKYKLKVDRLSFKKTIISKLHQSDDRAYLELRKIVQGLVDFSGTDH